MENNQEGPELREVRSLSFVYKVCGDCKYHRVKRWMCGSKSVTDNYYCEHPDVHDALYSTLGEKGRSIAFNSEKTPETPTWCPFLKPNH